MVSLQHRALLVLHHRGLLVLQRRGLYPGPAHRHRLLHLVPIHCRRHGCTMREHDAGLLRVCVCV
jgi:hypothetical protein